jgi:hypothetical protein
MSERQRDHLQEFLAPLFLLGDYWRAWRAQRRSAAVTETREAE